MATNEELLEIVMAIRASGLGDAEAVNAILARTGNTSSGAAIQVQGLTDAHGRHASMLQTLNGYNMTYGEQLSAQEARYAELQLASGGLTKAHGAVALAERDVAAEGNAAARAFGAIGERGAGAFERVSALGGVMGSSGLLGIGMGAALVGGGLVIEMGKSMIDNADHNETAQRGLAQAFDSQGKNLHNYQGQIDAWITKNAAFIGSEYDAKDAFAAVTRAGFDWTTSQRIVNDALDLAAIKGITVSDATNMLIKAHSGDTRALKDLGIASKDLENPQALLLKATKDVAQATDVHTKAVKDLNDWEVIHSDRSKLTQADLIHERDLKDHVTKSTSDLTKAHDDLTGAQKAVKEHGDKFNITLDLLETRTKNAHTKVSDLHQKSNELGVSWQKLSDENGPGLEAMLASVVGDLDQVVGGVDRGLNSLRAFGNDTAAWKKINDGFITMVEFVTMPIRKIGELIGLLSEAANWLDSLGGGGSPGGAAAAAMKRHAAGGEVMPNEMAIVGEEGPELLIMGSSGGFIVPNLGNSGLGSPALGAMHGGWSGAGSSTASLLQEIRDLLARNGDLLVRNGADSKRMVMALEAIEQEGAQGSSLGWSAAIARQVR